MTRHHTRGVLRLTARLAVAGAMTLGAVRGASADDAGIHDFFSAIFGGGAEQTQVAPVPQPNSAWPAAESRRVVRSRPLTVRLRKPAAPRVAVTSDVPTKPVKVSIFEDRTLRRGDAVMTAHGIRIFAGSSSWPYAPDDFVSLEQAGRMNKDTSKVLAQLDRMPRG